MFGIEFRIKNCIYKDIKIYSLYTTINISTTTDATTS